MTTFLTLFPGKNTPVSGKSTVNLRQFSPKTHYFSSYLHNLPYPKHFSTIQTILIPRIGSRKRRKKGSCAKKGYKNISQRSDPYMQTIMQGSYPIRCTRSYSTKTHCNGAKCVDSSATFSYFMQHYPKKHGALLRFFHRYSECAIKSCAA